MQTHRHVNAVRRALFVINPIAGRKRHAHIEGTIRTLLGDRVHCEFISWVCAGQDLESLVGDCLSRQQFDVLVAVGGDGTANKVARVAEDNSMPLYIIPTGSGNGLARQLGIPMQLDEAVLHLLQATPQKVDIGLINGQPFFCAAGLGFDAHVGDLFAKNKTRGFIGYARIVLTELLRYEPQEYVIHLNGHTLRRTAFIVAFANASQYGNEAHIAPLADIRDGLIDLVVVRKFSLLHAPVMACRLFNKTLHRSRFVEIIKSKEILLTQQYAAPHHADGEPCDTGHAISVSIKPLALTLLAKLDA